MDANGKKSGIYSIYDRVAEIYSAPQIYRRNGIAIRAYLAGLKESPYRDDYWLYKIGDFDEEEGTIEPCRKERIITGETDV